MCASNVEVPQEWHFHNCRLYSTKYYYKVILNILLSDIHNVMHTILYLLHLKVTKQGVACGLCPPAQPVGDSAAM